MINALDMALKNRQPTPGGVVHADHGTQFTSWAFGEKIRSAGLMPSFGTVGDGLDNAMMESFWSSMQIELLNRRKWNTRIEFANAIFEYIEIFYNRRRRRHSAGQVNESTKGSAFPPATQSDARQNSPTGHHNRTQPVLNRNPLPPHADRWIEA